VCDPMEDVDVYLRIAEETGMRISYVLETHLHADHVSGGRKLAELSGAKYILYADSGANYDFSPVREGDELIMGNVRIRVLHTPGHTPEHISFVVTELTRGTEPWFLLSGHTLMVGDMGRTELASNAEEGAQALFESAQKLKSLPTFVEVLPGAFSGSVCGRSLSGKPVSTIGFERKFNLAFGIDDREDFVEYMLRSILPAPPHASEIRAFNLGLSLRTA
jgi:hydroxyacylglutathione hydrolase